MSVKTPLMGLLVLQLIGILFCGFVFLMGFIAWIPIRHLIGLFAFSKFFISALVTLVTAGLVMEMFKYIGRRYERFEQDKRQEAARKALSDYVDVEAKKQAEKEQQEKERKETERQEAIDKAFGSSEPTQTDFNSRSTAPNVSSSNPRFGWGKRNRN